MNRVFLEIKGRSNLSPLKPPPPPPLQIQSDKGFNLDGKVSPSILLIIIILAIIFFISGLLHLLVRFLLKPPNTRDPDDFDNVTALQGQLQQLFHLHDSGVDQTFIDSLPVFHYKEIIGVKDPFDCAVCLCEFEADDKLRLLPQCSHAFHMDCIDTWLLSHSTCPLCRSSLLFDFPLNTNNDGCILPPIPIVRVLQSGSDSSREIGSVPASVAEKDSSTSLGLGIHGSNSRRLGDSEFGSSRRKSCEIYERNEAHSSASRQAVNSATGDQKIVAIKLGKFRNVDGFVGEGSAENSCSSSSTQNSSNVGAGGSRRCYSMGSFAYVLDESSSLQVPIPNSVKMKKAATKKPLRPGHRSAISEYGSDSRREFNGVEAFATIDQLCSSDSNKNKGQGSARIDKRKDSFSISKIWLRGDDNNSKKKDKASNNNNNNNPNAASSKRAVSSRFSAAQQSSSSSSSAVATGVGKSGTVNWRSSDSVSGGTDQVEIEMEGLENGGGSDEETQSCYSLDSQVMQTSSSTRRTLHWLMSKQNKVVHSSFSSNV